MTCEELVDYLWGKSVYKNYFNKKGNKYELLDVDSSYWMAKKLISLAHIMDTFLLKQVVMLQNTKKVFMI